MDPRKAAEAAFKPAAPKLEVPAPRTAELPEEKELVSLRIDRAVLEHFRAGGPGWQERLNAALKQVVGK